MEIYFKNDGSYNSSVIYAPIIVSGSPIGFVQCVTADKVVCQLWDRCVANEYLEDGRLASICIDTKDWGFRN